MILIPRLSPPSLGWWSVPGSVGAAFLVRIAAITESLDAHQRASFLVGAVIADDVAQLVRQPILKAPARIWVGGRQPQRSLYTQAASARTQQAPVFELEDGLANWASCPRCAGRRRSPRQGVQRNGGADGPSDHSMRQPTPGPDNLTENQTAGEALGLDGDQRIFTTGLIGPQDQVPPAQIEPANERHTFGRCGDDLALKLLRIRDRSIDGRQWNRSAGPDPSRRRSPEPPPYPTGWEPRNGRP